MLWIEPAPPEGFPWGQLAAVVAIWLLWLCISRWTTQRPPLVEGEAEVGST